MSGSGNNARRFDAVLCDVDGCLAPETTEPMDVRALAQIADWNRAASATEIVRW